MAITLRADATAGLTVAAMLVPQAMAYALLAGLPPAAGLAAAALPLIAYAIAGYSPRVAMGPAAIDSLLTATALHSLNIATEDRVVAAATLATLIGIIHVLAASAGLSKLVRHLSRPALDGFIAGAAVLIFLSQVKHLTGAPVETATTAPGRILNALAVIGQIDVITILIATASIALLILLRRTPVPAALGTVVAMTAVSAAMVNPSATVGQVPAFWPSLDLGGLDLGLIVQLVPMAVVIAIVGFMETLAVTTIESHATQTQPRRELFGLGLANIVSGLSAGMPVTAGLSRSAVNAEAGASSRRAGAITAGAVIVTAGLFTPLVASLPMATLASVVVVAVIRMVDWRTSMNRLLSHSHRSFAFAAAITILLGATAGIVATIGTSLVVWAIHRPTRPLRSSHSSHIVRTYGVSGRTTRQSHAAANPPAHTIKDQPMHFAQYYLDCLSQASYLIGDTTTGRAVVVDPRRDIDEYVTDASEMGLTIELILETHFHADFLSGHLELAQATGAEIAYAEAAETAFASRKLADGEKISLGDVQLEIRHTPGHTPESMSIVVWENAGDAEPWGVLTGDTMFIGDVGRPDLLSSIGFTREDLASQLYDSLQNKLLTLPDSTRVWPGHGAGSSCGKNLSSDTSSTIGAQRETNYALQAPDRSAFVELVTTGQPVAPSYFAYDAMLNRQERDLLDEHTPPTSLNSDEVRTAVAAGAAVLDGRSPEEFAVSHVPGSINVGLGGRYAEFAGAVLSPDTDIVLVADADRVIEARNRLARIGFDRVIGSPANPSDLMSASAERLSAAQYAVEALDGTTQLVDVRNPGETADGVIDGAIEIPVGQLRDRLAELDSSKRTVVYCAGGYRSSVAASLLRQAGFADVADIDGGWSAWSDRTAAPA